MTFTMTAADRLEMTAGLDFSVDENQAVYTINAVSDALGVHPETIRVWERRGVIEAERENNRRLFSRLDVMRLEFVRNLLDKGFTLVSIKEYLRFYPCWSLEDCRLCRNALADNGPHSKDCWKYPRKYCSVINMPDYHCQECQACRQVCQTPVSS